MNDPVSLSNFDSLLIQHALQTRELSQRSNELKQQIKVCRANIAERKSYIESLNSNILNLEEETRRKQSAVTHNKGNAKSMRATNSLLQGYEQRQKAELESRKASYKHDMEVYEERITSYRKKYHSHRAYYYQSPLAQELLMLQAENEEIEGRMKSYDEQIAIKQMKLAHLTGLAANSSATEQLCDNISQQQPIPEPEKQLNPLIENESDSPIVVSFLEQTKNDLEEFDGENAAEINEEDIVYNRACDELLNEQSGANEIHNNEQDMQSEIQDQVMEQPTTASNTEDPVESSASIEKDQALRKERGNTQFSQSSSQDTNESLSPVKMKAASSIEPFIFNFSPTSSSCQVPSDRKSPAFLFSANSDQSTPAFSGFVFDISSSQDEETSFTFSNSFFNEKNPKQSQSSSCSGFQFEQPEQGEDFQFAFTSQSPQAPTKDDSKDEFPFLFNF